MMETSILASASSCLETTEEYATYEWSTGSTTDTIHVNSGTFTVTVTDEFGCSGTSEPFTVTNSAPEAQVAGVTNFVKVIVF
ncbi:MAG: hypothetical protein R2850_09805 [Bacteroidia bacterium]